MSFVLMGVMWFPHPETHVTFIKLGTNKDQHDVLFTALIIFVSYFYYKNVHILVYIKYKDLN